MMWLIWRQHRSQATLAAAALIVLVVILAITGVNMAATYHDALRTCVGTGTCDSVGDGLFNGDGAILDLVGLTVAVPLLLGLFWGAPLLAAEIENGTHKLVWTQSITRRRWLASKTVAVVTASAAVAAVLAVAVTWWSRTIDLSQHNRFDHFDVQGIVPVGYAIFAATTGLAAGILIRRTLPALGATLLAVVGIRIAIANYLRPHFLAPLTKSVPLTASDTGLTGSFWTLQSHIVDNNGSAVTNDGLLSALPVNCRQYIGTTRDQILSCVSAHGWREQIVYQPANRFWTFQGIETGIYIALACALVLAAFVLIRRDA